MMTFSEITTFRKAKLSPSSLCMLRTVSFVLALTVAAPSVFAQATPTPTGVPPTPTPTTIPTPTGVPATPTPTSVPTGSPTSIPTGTSIPTASPTPSAEVTAIPTMSFYGTVVLGALIIYFVIMRRRKNKTDS